MRLIFNGEVITGYILELSLESALDDFYTTLNITLPYKIVKKYKLAEGQGVVLSHKDYEMQGIALKFSDSSNDTVKFMIVSYAWYLTVNEDTFQFNDKIAANALNDIFDRYEISKDVISYSYDSSTKFKFERNFRENFQYNKD